MSKLTSAILKQQDDVCSTAVITLLKGSAAFQRLAQSEGEGIIKRDQEDEEKLAAGIDIAIAKGILKGKPDVSPITKINVVGLTAEQVTEEVVRRLPGLESNVIVLQGLSGTGKGTTVAKLQRKLPRCVTWSNGNVFRSYTYLSHEILSKEGKSLTTANLTPALLSAVEKRVTFEKCADGQYRTLIDGTTRVEDIQNTTLKQPVISANVPTVAQETQGEVIRFGAGAVKVLSEAGFNVILEGRAQTLNYIPTKERFELVIPEANVLGQRRAAQRVMAKALEMIGAAIETVSEEDVVKAVEGAAEAL